VRVWTVKALEEPVQVVAGIDAAAQATAQQAVERGRTLAGAHVSNEQKVLLVMLSSA
jgi:hypothetical protein